MSKARREQQTPSVGWFLLGTALGLVPGLEEHRALEDVAVDGCFVARHIHGCCVSPQPGPVLVLGMQ